MRITSLLILIGIVVLMFTGQSAYQSDVEYETERDIYNFTESKFNWSSNYAEILPDTPTEKVQILEYNVNIGRFKSILGKFIDFLGYSSFEVAKWGIEYGYEHPEHDLEFFLNFLIKILWICVIIALVPLIIPLLALVYLLCKGICYLIKKIKRYLKNETQIKKTKG